MGESRHKKLLLSNSSEIRDVEVRQRVVSRVKTAAFPPFSKQGPPPPPNENGAGKRNIPTEHPYDPRALKPLSRMLWAMSVSLGHALTAYRQFTKLKSSTISPDGMLGGRGYIQPIKEVRQSLYEACEILSAISDTIHDEISAPHWKPKLSQLDPSDAEDVQRFVEESQQILSNPEEDAQEEMDAIEDGDDSPDEDGEEDTEDTEEEESEASGLPGGASDAVVKQASGSYRYFRGNSSLPVDTLPGPRVNHLGPGEGQGPLGGYNTDEPRVQDGWGLSDGFGFSDDYAYPTPWDNDLRESNSAIPDADYDPTETDAWDFGLGFGAKGQGAGGYENPGPDGKGVLGPRAGLPDGDGSQRVEDTTPMVEVKVNERSNVWAQRSLLPTDLQEPVARSDYYDGPNDHLVSQSQLPADFSNTYQYDRDLMNKSEKFERHDTPYVLYDYTTHTNRPDPNFSRPHDKAFSQ